MNKYHDADIMLCVSRVVPKLLTAVIKWLTGSQWNHARLIWIRGDGVPMVVESAACGQVVKPLGRAKSEDKSWVILRHNSLGDRSAELITNSAIDQTGKPYGYRDLLTMVWRLIKEKLRPTFGPRTFDIDDEPHFVCTSLIALSYREAGLDLFPASRRGLVYPSDYLHHPKLGRVAEFRLIQ